MMAFEVRGFRELDWRLRMTVARLRSDLPATMQTIAEMAAEAARARIGHEWPDWAPLAESTVRQKRRLGYVGRISETDPLYRTGAMRASIRGEGDAMVAEVRANAPARWQELGTRDFRGRSPLQGRALQNSGMQGIPPRPFLRPALMATVPEAKRLLAEIFETAIQES